MDRKILCYTKLKFGNQKHVHISIRRPNELRNLIHCLLLNNNFPGNKRLMLLLGNLISN